MTAVDPALRRRAADWIARDPDPETRAELEALLAAGDREELARRFAGRLAFGTAGLRGAMGAGPARMNRLVVRESAAGISRYLRAAPGAAERGVVVAHDARRRSARFAADCAEVLAANGVRALRIEGAAPTPVAVFAIRELGAAAGLVVTASHNPAADNGLKLYGGDGAQIVPPVDARVAAAIDAVAADGRVVGDGPPAPVDDAGPAALAAYRSAALGRVPPAAAPLRVATTAMHGVGGALLADLLAAAGHADVHAVTAQERPDPDFPTVPFPNPEEPGATDLLAALMRERGAAIGTGARPGRRPARGARRGAGRRGAAADRRRPRGAARRVAARRGDGGPRATGGVERRVLVPAGPGRRGPRRGPRRDPDRLQVAFAAGAGAP